MSQCNVSHALASAALNWSMGDQYAAVDNLIEDIQSIMAANSVSWPEAVTALTLALADCPPDTYSEGIDAPPLAGGGGGGGGGKNMLGLEPAAGGGGGVGFSGVVEGRRGGNHSRLVFCMKVDDRSREHG